MGMKKPVHILQLGASVEEMINMAAVAVIDAQEKEKIIDEYQSLINPERPIPYFISQLTGIDDNMVAHAQ